MLQYSLPEKYPFREVNAIPDVSTNAKSFLRSHIASIWQLELILHLRSLNAPRTAQDIAKALYISSDAIERALANFETLGLARANKDMPKTYIYSPANDEIRQSLDDAIRAYNTQRSQVVNIIYSAPLQPFSDASRLRRKDA